jgi:uncharacterized membrane protein YfhO
VEDPGQGPASLRWNGFDEVEVHGRTVAGQSLLIQETWDPAWHAYDDGRELPVRRDGVVGFMLVDVPAGDRKIRLRFETPLENRAGQLIFALTAATMCGLAFSSRYRRRIV